LSRSKIREELIKLLEEDREFRLMVAGLIGLGDILKKLEEHDRKFNEILIELRKHDERLEELNKRLEEQGKRLEEHGKILEKHTKILEEHSMILREHSKILEKHSMILEKLSERIEKQGRILEEHTKILSEHRVALGSIGKRMGLGLERTLLKVYEDLLEKRGISPSKVEKFIYIDYDGRYYRRGAKIEVDIYAHNEEVTLIEIKSLIEEDDVYWFYEKAKIVERIIGKEASRLLIVGVNAVKEAVEEAQKLGIDIICGSIIE